MIVKKYPQVQSAQLSNIGKFFSQQDLRIFLLLVDLQ